MYLRGNNMLRILSAIAIAVGFSTVSFADHHEGAAPAAPATAEAPKDAAAAMPADAAKAPEAAKAPKAKKTAKAKKH
jgi:hypothetical protein